MQEKLTDRAYWKKYWEAYRYEEVPVDPVYRKQAAEIKTADSFIEIGGFPGINSVYFYKNNCPSVSLLDFYIDQDMVNRLEQHNGLPENTIHCIEADFFNFRSEKKYDIVFSLGFIEHFKDTGDVLRRHVELLAEGGRLLVILPNFRGINGCVQWLFDRKNLKVHNLKSMKIPYLRDVLSDLTLKNVTVEYSDRPMVWLEPAPGVWNVIKRKLVKALSLFLKLFPFRGRLLSAYIIITADK